MLTQLEIFKSGVTTPPLNVTYQDVSLDYLQILDVDGLGPVDASVDKSAYGNVDGEYVSGLSTRSRNIVLTIGLNPDWHDQTIGSLRDILYQYFMPKSTVELQFTTTDKPKVTISGIVDKMTPAIFTQNPLYQVSILCPDSDFVSLETTSFDIVADGLTAQYNEIDHWNVGNVNTGFTLVTKPASAGVGLTEFRIVNYTDDFQMFIAQRFTLLTGQSLKLVTQDRQHSFRKYYDATTYDDLIGSVEPSGAWIQIRQNLNRLGFISNPAGMQATVSYNARFGGL